MVTSIVQQNGSEVRFGAEVEEILWTNDRVDAVEVKNNGQKELETLGLIQASDVEDGVVVRMPKAYPVYDSTYRESLKIIRQFLNRINNLQLVGRNGMHKYNNQDHSMLTAMLAAENIQGANHDLWKVNTEQEYHEEVEDEEKERDKALTQTFARMDKLGLATAVGSVCSLVIFIATLWLVVKGSTTVVPYFQMLEQYFIGYTVTVKGAFIGIGYGFLWGFIWGWLLAYLRNFFLGIFMYIARKKAELLSLKDFLDYF